MNESAPVELPVLHDDQRSTSNETAPVELPAFHDDQRRTLNETAASPVELPVLHRKHTDALPEKDVTIRQQENEQNSSAHIEKVQPSAVVDQPPVAKKEPRFQDLAVVDQPPVAIEEPPVAKENPVASAKEDQVFSRPEIAKKTISLPKIWIEVATIRSPPQKNRFNVDFLFSSQERALKKALEEVSEVKSC